MLNLTQNVKDILSSAKADLQLICEIDGINFTFGISTVKKLWAIGDDNVFIGDEGLVIGGRVDDPKSLAVIDRQNFTKRITQQLDIEQGASSISTMSVRLIDEEDNFMELFSPTEGSEQDILTRGCTIYLGFKDGSHPIDSVVLFDGIISQVLMGFGYIDIVVSHPEELKEQTIFKEWTTELIDAIGEADDDTIYMPDYERPVFGEDAPYTIGPTGHRIYAKNPLYGPYYRKENLFPYYESMLHDEFGDIPSGPKGGVISEPVKPYQVFWLIDEEVIDFKINEAFSVENSSQTPSYFSYPKSFYYMNERGLYNTIASEHEAEAEVKPLFVFKGNPIDLSLMIYCSTKNGDRCTYAHNKPIKEKTDRYVLVDYNTIRKENIQIGDMILFHQDEEFIITHEKQPDHGFFIPPNIPDNSFVNFTRSIVNNIEVDGELAKIYFDYKPTGAISYVSFISKWNRLPEGCGISNRFIDFEQFSYIKNLYSSEIVDCHLIWKEEIDDARSFVDQVFLRPQGMYSLPRKGKISIGKTTPPLASEEVKVLNEENILTPLGSIKFTRSITNHFYNSVVFQYEPDVLEDDFLRNSVSIDAESLQKIKTGLRELVIEAKSLRDVESADKIASSSGKKILDLYAKAPESLSLDVTIEAGLAIDVGDSVILDMSRMNAPDIKSRSKSFIPRVVKVINKEFNITNGVSTLELLTSLYNPNGRYGVISPSSHVKSGSTSQTISLKRWQGQRIEKEKWYKYLNQEVAIRSNDWSTYEVTRIVGFDSVADAVLVEPLSFVPTEGMILECPRYDNSSPLKMAMWKAVNVFINPTVEAISFNANSVTVAPGDISRFTIGSIFYLHDRQYTDKSNEVKVESISGNTLNLSSALTYAPTSGEINLIELIGFQDGGAPYRLI